jgi:hypothetical protein
MGVEDYNLNRRNPQSMYSLAEYLRRWTVTTAYDHHILGHHGLHGL